MKLRIKYLVEKAIKMMLKLFSVFPVRSNRILFQSFSGRQYSDSPRAISQWLTTNHPGKLEIIWAFNDPEKHEHLKEQGITVVRYKSLRYLYYALTCRVYVDNVEPWSILHFRSGQTVINTWHGGGTFKQVGIYRQDTGELEKQHVIDKMAETDIFISSSAAFSQQTIRDSFRYEGEIMECGLPRNDQLLAYDASQAEEIRRKLNLDERKVVLYAPTFRNALDSKVYDLEPSGLLKALNQRFGGQWQLLVRSHYYLDKPISLPESRDVSDYPEMNDLLQIADVLITDYSSSIWEFALMKKPCFLYCPDVAEYNCERTFYSDPQNWPAILSENNEQLQKAIRNFDVDAYQSKVEHYLDMVGIRESGHACQKLGQRIIQLCSETTE